jgi:hypothetical protein
MAVARKGAMAAVEGERERWREGKRGGLWRRGSVD